VVDVDVDVDGFDDVVGFAFVAADEEAEEEDGFAFVVDSFVAVAVAVDVEEALAKA